MKKLTAKFSAGMSGMVVSLMYDKTAVFKDANSVASRPAAGSTEEILAI